MVVALRDLLVFEGLVIEFPHPVLQLFLLRFHGADVLEHRHAFIEHRATGEVDTILRQIARTNAFHPVDGAVVEAFNAGHYLEQGRLARPIAADNTDALLRRNEPVQVFKQCFGAEAFSGFG